jgi:serralysin
MALKPKTVGSVIRWFAVALTVVLASTGSAQPPNYDAFRWSGETALAQPQGFVQGAPMTLTWGFMALGTPINDPAAGYPSAANNLQTRFNEIYGSQAIWQPHFQSVFDRWSSISGLSFVYEPNDDGATIVYNSGTDYSFPTGVVGVRADVRIGGKAMNGNSGVLAYNYYPNVGEMVFDTNDDFYENVTGNSLRLRNVIAHEHGHGMGMPHVVSNNANFLMEPFLSTAFDGPQYHDVLAAQRLYGDALEKSNAGLGNDAAANASSLGNLTTTASLRIGQSARTFLVAPTATDFVSIDDASDLDFYSFDVAGEGHLNVHLESFGFLYNVTPQGGPANVPFDTKRRSDLALALFGSDGSTMLQSVDLSGLGGNESLFFTLGGAGTYFLRVSGRDNADNITLDTQFYGLTLNFNPVPEPASLALVVLAFAAWRLRGRAV